MAKPQQINIDAFNDLEKKIKVVYGELVKLDVKLDAGVIKRFYDLAKGVNEFAKALQKLGKTADVDLGTAVKQINDMLTQIVKLDKALESSGKKLDTKAVVEFATFLSDLISTFNKASGLSADINKYKDIEKVIKILTEALDNIKVSETVAKSVFQITRALEAIFNVLKNPALEGTSIRQFQSVMNTLAGTFLQLSKSLKDRKKSVATLENYSTLIQMVADIFTKASDGKFDEKVIQNLRGAFGAIQNFVFNLLDSTKGVKMGRINAFKIYLGALSELFTALNLPELMSKIGKAEFNPTALTSLYVSLKAISDFLGDLIKTSKEASIGDMIKVQRFVTNLVTLFKGLQLGEIFAVMGKENFQASHADAFRIAFGAVTSMLFGIAGLAKEVGLFFQLPKMFAIMNIAISALKALDFSSLEIFTKQGGFSEDSARAANATFTAVFNFMEAMAKAAGKMSLPGILKFFLFADVVSEQIKKMDFGFISALTNIKTPAPGAFESLNAAFGALFTFFAVMAERVRNIGVAQIFKLNLAMNGMASFFGTGIISAIMGAIVVPTFDINKIQTLNGIFVSIISFIETLIQRANKVSFKEFFKIVVVLPQLTEVLRRIDLTELLKAIGNPNFNQAGFEAFQNIMREIFQFVNDIQSLAIGSGMKEAIKNLVFFRPFMQILDGVANILNALQIGEIGPNKLKAISSIFRAITQLMEIIQTVTGSHSLFSSIAREIFGSQGIFSIIFTILHEVGRFLEIAGQTDFRAVQGIGNAFRGLGYIFQSFGKIVDQIQGVLGDSTLRDFIKVAVNISLLRLYMGQIIRVVRLLLNEVVNFDDDKLSALGRFMRGLGEIFQGMGATMNALSKSSYQSLDLKTFVRQLINLQLTLIPVRSILNSVLKSTQGMDTPRLAQMAVFAQGLGTIINAITLMFQTLERPPISSKNIFARIFDQFIVLRKITGPIKAFINAMKGLPDGGAVKALVDLFEILRKTEDLGSIGDRFALLSKGFEGADSKGLKTFFKNLGQDLVVFQDFVSKIKLEDLDKVEKLAKAMETISKVDLNKITSVKFDNPLNNNSELKSAKVDLNQINDLSKEVSEGIVDAFLRISGLGTPLKRVAAGLHEIYEAFGSLSTRAKDFVSGLREGFKQLGSDLREFGENMREVGQNIIDNIGIGKLTSSAAFTSSVEFDKLGTSLQVFGGLSDEQRKKAEDFANVIGKDYPLSANEALNATLDLIKAGQSLESTEFILPAAADLASLSDSGSIENATAFIIQATSTFKDFSDTVAGGFDNADVAVNIIAAAADSSTASVEGLAEGLAKVGPIASQFGLSLEETTGILAIFTDGGISGAEAGTQLKSFLTNLTTKTAQKELARLGVEIQDTEGNFRSMNDILNDLQDAMYSVQTVSYTTSRSLSADQRNQLNAAEKALAAASRQQFLIGNDLNATGLGENADEKMAQAQTIAENAKKIIADLTGSDAEAQRIVAEIERTELQNAESLKKIAGSYGQSGLAILLAQGEDGLAQFVEQMRAVEPASVRAKKALDNISGDMLQLQGSVETLTTKALVPLLEKFFRPFVKFGRFVVDSILALDESVIEFTSTALVLGSALATVAGVALIVGGVFVQIGGAIFSALAVLSSLSALVASGALVAFFASMAAGAAALAAAFTVIVPILALITTGFNTLYSIFNEDRGGAFTQLANLAENVGRTFSGLGAAIGDFMTFVNVAFGGSATSNIDSFGAALASFFNRVSLSVTKFQTSGAGKTLIDAGRIFKGFATALSLESAFEEATRSAADSVDDASRIPAAAAKARKAVSREYTQMVLDLAKNNSILSNYFGKENLTFENVEGFLQTGVQAVTEIRSAIGNVFGSFSRAFDVANLVGKTEGFGAALGKFFETLGPDLDKSLGILVNNILASLSSLFGLEQDFSFIFGTKGFAAGMKAAFAKAMKSVGDFLLNNRNGIKGILTFVFEKLTLGGLSLGRTIANMLGLENVASFFDDAINTITSIFGGIVDTIFNLIEGMSLSDALLDAFGPGIQPVIDLMDAFGEAVDNILGFIGKLFGGLQGEGVVADPNAPSFLVTLFNTVLSGLTGFITFLNDNVLSFLADGDIAGLVNNIATKINSVLLSIDPVTAFKSVADTVVGAISDAIEAGFSLIGSVLGFDGAKLFADIDAGLKAALDAVDPTSALALVQGAITDLVTSLQNLFGADGTSIIDSIITIVDKFRLAFEQLFSAFSSPNADAAATKGPTLKDVFQGILNVFGGVVAGTINTITDFADGLGLLADKIAGMNPGEILLLGSALTLTLGGIALYAGVPAIMTALGLSSFTLSGGLSALGSTMAAKAGALLVFIQFFRAIAQNLGEFQKVIDAFQNGDIGAALSEAIGAFSKVFVDLGFNLLEMLGITEIFGLSRDEFKRVADMMVALLRNAASRAGDHIKQFVFQPISDFINITVPLMFSELERLGTKAQAAIPGNTDAQIQGQRLDVIDQTAFGNFDFTNLSLDEQGRTPIAAFIEDVVMAGGDQTVRRLGAQAARDNALIFGSALADYNWLDTLDAETRATVQPQIIANMVSLFNTAGLNDEILQQALASGNTGFFQALVEGMLAQGITITPEMQAGLAASISAGFDLTNVDAANAKLAQLDLAIDTFTALRLDPAQLIAERDRLKGEIDAFLATGELPPAEVDTDVDVTVNPPTVTNPEDVPGGVQGAVDGAVPADGVVVDVPVQVRPKFGQFNGEGTDAGPLGAQEALQKELDDSGFGFDLSTLGDPAAVESFQSLVVQLAADVVNLARELNALPDTQIIVTTTLSEIQTQITTFRDITVPLFGEVKLAVDPIAASINAINSALVGMFAIAAIGFPVMAVSAVSSMATIAFQFLLLHSASDLHMTAVVNKVKELGTAFIDAGKAATALANNPAFNGVAGSGGDGGSGIQIGDGMAEGGRVFPGLIYPFLEKDMPELLTIGSNTYLATPKAGVVTPMIPDRSAASRTGVYGGQAQTRSGAFGSTNAGTSVTIVEGDINVTVTGANVSNESQLVARIAKAVEQQQARRTDKLSDKLRTNHR